MNSAQVRSRCPTFRDATAEDIGYVIQAFGATITLHFDRDGSMTAAAVRGGNLRTHDGHGPGSTVADLSVLGSVKEVLLCDGVPAAVIYRARPVYAFWFRECNASQAVGHLDLPDTTRVLVVEIAAPGGG